MSPIAYHFNLVGFKKRKKGAVHTQNIGNSIQDGDQTSANIKISV